MFHFSSYVDSVESHSRREVTLTKQNNGLGLEIIGGNKVGILISKVKPSSAASSCGLVKGMRILKVYFDASMFLCYLMKRRVGN